MTDFEVRLYITPLELLEFFCFIENKYDLFPFLMEGQTGSPENIANIIELQKKDELKGYLYFFPFDPEKMFKQNPPLSNKPLPDYFDGKLKFILPIQTADSLDLCNVSARTQDYQEILCWKKVTSDLRKKAPLCPVEISSSRDGKIYPSNKHRVTSGAKECYENGIKLYEIFSKSYYILK